jgi:hypothetical protein
MRGSGRGDWESGWLCLLPNISVSEIIMGIKRNFSGMRSLKQFICVPLFSVAGEPGHWLTARCERRLGDGIAHQFSTPVDLLSNGIAGYGGDRSVVCYVTSWVWGTSLICETVLRSILAWSIPIEQFLIISPIIGYGIYFALIGWTFWFVRRLKAAAHTKEMNS